MSAALCEEKFSRANSLVDKINASPSRSIDFSFLKFIILTLFIRFVIFSLINKYQKRIENSKISEHDAKLALEKLKKLRDKLFLLDQKLVKNNQKGIIYKNIHNALIKVDDFIENLEIYLDSQIRELVKELTTCL
jgi:hypothetical protein